MYNNRCFFESVWLSEILNMYIFIIIILCEMADYFYE